MFTALGLDRRSTLSDQLGGERNEDGALIINPVTEATSVAGVFAADDALRDVLLVIVAAAEGTKAAIAIARTLVEAHGKKAATVAAN